MQHQPADCKCDRCLASDAEVDALFASLGAPARLDPGVRPSDFGPSPVRLSGARRSELADRAASLLRERGPAGWWWEIVTCADGGIVVVACPRGSTDVGVVALRGDGAVAYTAGAPRAVTPRAGVRAYSIREVRRDPPRELEEVAEILRTAFGRVAA